MSNTLKLIAGEENFTLIVEDPVANSYVQNVYPQKVMIFDYSLQIRT
jgi:C4-type Zn-finger protein